MMSTITTISRPVSHGLRVPRLMLCSLAVLWALSGCAATADKPPLGETAEARAMAAVTAPLLNTYWKLRQIGDGPLGGTFVSAFDNQPEAHLVLEQGTGRFHGAGGCNRLHGSYQLDGRWLQLAVAGTTRMACAQGGRMEQLFISMLAQVSSYAVQGQKLTLSDADGRVLLRFEAVYLR